MKKIIIILLLSFLFPEKFIYSLGFKFITVGEATISSGINSDNELTINTLVASNKFLDRLYEIYYPAAKTELKELQQLASDDVIKKMENWDLTDS